MKGAQGYNLLFFRRFGLILFTIQVITATIVAECIYNPSSLESEQLVELNVCLLLNQYRYIYTPSHSLCIVDKGQYNAY